MERKRGGARADDADVVMNRMRPSDEPVASVFDVCLLSEDQVADDSSGSESDGG